MGVWKVGAGPAAHTPTHPHPHTPRQRAGLTLIEMIIALAILVILTGGLSLAFRTGLDANERARRKVEAAQDAHIILDTLRADIEQATVTPGADRSWFMSTDSMSDEQDDDELYLTTRSHRVPLAEIDASDDWEALSHHADWSAVVYTLTSLNGDRGGLYRREQVPPGLDPLEDTDTAEEELVSSSVVGLNFRFHDGVDWVESWDTTADTTLGAPRAVEVTVVVQLDPASDETQAITAVFPVWPRVQAPEEATTTGAVPADPGALGAGGLGGGGGASGTSAGGMGGGLRSRRGRNLR